MKLNSFNYELLKNIYKTLDFEEVNKENENTIKLNFFKENWLSKEEIEIYDTFLKIDFKEFYEKYLINDLDLATFEITEIIFDTFFNKMFWFVWVSSVYTDILKEVNDLLKEGKIKEFDEWIIWINWNKIERKWKQILKKYKLLEKNWYIN